MKVSLNTPFAWFDSIEDINYCDNCDGNILSPCNDLLPFIINSQLGTITEWKLIDENANEIDISSCINLLNIVSDSGNNYIIYNGLNLQSCLPIQMDCKKWYSTISDGITTYYSSKFNVVSITEEPTLYEPYLRSGWAYHINENSLSYKQKVCLSIQEFTLLSTNTELPPFIIKRNAIANTIQTWVLRSIDGDCEINLDTTQINITNVGSFDYLTYNNTPLSNLSCGKYISIISDGVNTFYGEPIEIVDDINDVSGEFILMENGAYMLQENKGKIKLE